MNPTLPMCSAPAAFRMLARQAPVMSSSDALLNGAIAIAMHRFEESDVAEVDATLQSYADTIRSRVGGSQPQALLAHLHALLFEELGFTGNAEDFYNPDNSYLPAVLATKRGLPITLSLIYKLVAERIGLRAWGVGLPGHFVVGVDCGGDEMLIDPFAGGSILTADEAHERLRALFGPDIEWPDELLIPTSHRHWLTRMLQNLLNIFGGAGRYADVAAMLEMEILLWPEQEHLQRDLALVLARCGLSQPASVWLDRYLRNNPEDPQKGELKQLLDVLTIKA